MRSDQVGVVDFPTLGDLIDAWTEQHCRVPALFARGEPFRKYDWQFWVTANHYRIREDAKWIPERPMLNQAFVFRRSLIVGPQKIGKGPDAATIVANEAVGPAVFGGWAGRGEGYDCLRDGGCPCGWYYDYEPGEAKGIRHPSPLIQLTATSQEQVDNVYGPLTAMIHLGPLKHSLRPRENFIRIVGNSDDPDMDRIDAVTSSALSRLGNPISFALQDEALALDTPLPTPSGWTTMGAVQVGDDLLGADGRPVRVIKATEVQRGRVCYRVSFADGTSMVASDGHLWQTRVASSAAQPAVRTTGQMARDGRRFRVPAPGAYDLPAADLPVHPYLLGLWLGDGSTGKQEITAHVAEAEELQQILGDVGVGVGIRMNPPPRAATLVLSSQKGYQASERPEWAKALSRLPCYRSKHIPAAYMRGSAEQRVALLQGLMDSDGHVTATGYCTFAGNERLCADVAALLRTLGVQVQPVSRVDVRARSGLGWKVNFTPRGGLQPFRLARKASRVRQAWGGSDWISITTIEAVSSVPVRCVGVDSQDHLFLAGVGSHVTHNTGTWTTQNKMRKVAETQRRGAAGMGGRTMEHTNCWDPAENSVAQSTWESQAEDVFRFYRMPPPKLRFLDKRERRKIFEHVYAGADHVNLDSIEAECAELMEKDPGQAERFFGNRVVQGAGAWLPPDLWEGAFGGLATAS